MTTYAYLRVSTDPQDHVSQERQLQDWATANGRTLDKFVRDTASGTTPWQERSLATILDAAAAGDAIIVSEISRIARSTIGVLTFLQEAAARGVAIYAVRNGIAIDGTIASKVLVTVFALVAEIERDFIAARTRAALAARRAAGKTLGRPLGSKSRSKVAAQLPEIRRLIGANVPKRAIARLLQCSPGTLYKAIADAEQHPVDDKTLPLPFHGE